eukprot:TRINITY_DN297_c0_g1_i1.p1 TRINITY_DN297_c0_g1~~TRINITY_DN297_c0_g1_i1.p1  ORF type:complete len:360 (+),score=110.03 TRINITY_DN297_c0_g1_i1:71-1081(+)
MRLIVWGENKEAVWMSAAELEQRIADSPVKWVGYMDVTDHPEFASAKPRAARAFPTQLQQQAIVNQILPKLNYLNLNDTIGTLEDYQNRFYNTATGVSSAEWIFSQFERIAVGSHLNITVRYYNHNAWDQPSVIATIQGTSNELLVMGAHIDSQAPGDRAPGADDDGCGVATLIEMFRGLVTTPAFVPKRTIEFMGYAAEEVGLRGSAEIASAYSQRDVYAVYQSEMCGWRGEVAEIILIDDAYTDPALVSFSETLVDGYCDIPSSRERCNSACSDHASWDRQGFSTICTAESGPSGDLNPNYHTRNDLLVALDTEFINEFVKYGIGFAVELSLAP